jgi:aminomethyltransferase
MSVSAAPEQTPLYALHTELGAKLVAFAGYAMPLHYARGIVQEHVHTRRHAGLFDVSHMGQIAVRGPASALEKLVPSDIEGLRPFQQRYTVLTNDTGGIVDDLMITRVPDGFFVVVNAAFRAQVFAHLEAGLKRECDVERHHDRALLALQGPAAATVLAAHCPQTRELSFMSAAECDVADIACRVNRCGYTGEDGFEISLLAADAERLARLLLEHERVQPIGLGARDSLRLEAGLCLAGTDIDANTTPVEAALDWIVARKYRVAGAAAAFPGADTILQQLKSGTARVRVGLRPRGRIPLRAETVLLDDAGGEVGRITSGSFAPTAGHPVAMGYVDRAFAAAGAELKVSIRGRDHAVEVAALPFIPHRYHRH